jgi:hypothetical protein
MCVSFRLTGSGARTSDRSARGLWRLDRFDYALEAKTCAFAGVLDRVRRDRVEDQEADLVVGDVDGPHKADTGAVLGELLRRSSRALCAPEARFAGTGEICLGQKAWHAETFIPGVGRW